MESSAGVMFIRYLFEATYQGRALSATFDTPTYIPDDPTDLFLLPGRGGFNCVGCNGFHFLRWPSYGNAAAVQFNDARSGGALTYLFGPGTFKQTGQYRSQDVGSGVGTLTITAIA